jgi:FAD binding domain
MATIVPRPARDWDAFHYNQRRNSEIHSFKWGQGPERFAESAEALGPYLRAACDACRSAAVLGSGWSLSELIGWDGQILATDGFDCLAWATADQLVEQPPEDQPKRLVFAGGGVKGYRLVEFLESEDWTLQTCGSYLGQSLAGSIATGVNGSRLGYGAFQNQVRGLHLITRDDHSVWIEPTARPALRDEAAAIFAQEIIRDDAMFADTLVHLGGMGFVNGLLIEAVPSTGFQVLARKKAVDQAWLASVRDGDFAAIAAWLGFPDKPELRLAYYEVQLDPFNWDNQDPPQNSAALHTLYFELAGTDRAPSRKATELPRVQGGFGPLSRGETGPQPWEVENLFAAYSDKFKEREPAASPPGGYTWGALHRAPPAEEWRPLIYMRRSIAQFR